MPAPFTGIARVLALAALLLGIATSLAAQHPGSRLREEMRVRIYAPAFSDTLLTGTVAFRTGSSAWIDPGRNGTWVEVPLDRIEQLDVSEGQPNRTLEGAALGAALGGVLLAGVALSAPCQGMCGADVAAVVGALGFIVGALPGAMVGAGVGHSIKAGPERWRRY